MAFESEAGFYFFAQSVADGFVEVGEDFHGELGLDSAVVDEVVDRVD